MSGDLTHLLKQISACMVCADELPLGPRPVVQASASAQILVVGQAPGKRVHETGIPFNDPSGDRLRSWMGVSSSCFYDEQKVALIPMGFCYPGTAKSGDLPPNKACAQRWRQALLEHLNRVELVLVIGQYAHAYHLAGQQGKNLTETVRRWREFWPDLVPMPHPSPRNNRWLARNPWFESEVVPNLQQRIASILG